MYPLPPRLCPACQQSFEPGRKNQHYCSASCRIDANNELAKARYASLVDATSTVDTLEAELNRLRRELVATAAQVATLTIVIEGVDEVNQDTISYQGHLYQRRAQVGRLGLRISLQAGGGLKVGKDKIVYRREKGSAHDYEYIRVA